MLTYDVNTQDDLEQCCQHSKLITVIRDSKWEPCVRVFFFSGVGLTLPGTAATSS
jgi:hypothetical protein